MYENIDQKYIHCCNQQHLNIAIEHVENMSFKHEIITNNTQTIIRLNMQKINEKDYERYLACQIRKLLLPHLSLETNRCLIRRYQEKDANHLIESLSDEATCMMDGGYAPFQWNDEYISYMKTWIEDESRFVIADKKCDEAIGIIHIMSVEDRVVETLELGYIINPSHRRKGLAYEAIHALTNLLLDDLYLDMILLGAIEENVPSIHLFHKLGFIFEGRRHQAFSHPIHGPIDLLYYYKDRTPE